ncbi:MBL fold metallo-hydrolase [Bradyrhizobium erythrophlei]|jgi:glyoxylase-like metal-dependent hydrolase (beta-lactamase superfamily II)|uniref:Glyoxylase, beta-lactamase superfamily II n=1 Tax=Bradyrhizobium erythrophlei TaxID=1437360 RepID=A0A1M5L4N5_9BRAD|nr:MBL fold metallo-hydrolase [Bradyrhizobium erythrophlei]SHG59946.1 Glyoxylase, beta-lactamase superfamily II [Bradyrhizobium erythrophlei]
MKTRSTCTLWFALLLGAAAWTVPAPVSAAAPQVRLQAPGFYRMVLGDFEITALLDGTHPFPAAEVLTKARADKSAGRSKLFTDDPEQANALLAASDLKAPTEGSINAFLINTGSKLVLIDSGAGTLYGSCCGHLIENLRASGYQPEQVDEVLLTHLHADHVGGIAPGGIAAFPNAIIRSSKLDADYWLNDENERAAHDFLRPMFEGDKASLKPYILAGRYLPFEGEQEMLPGIRAIPTPGHTPGHTSYMVESRGQKLLVWGDVVHVAPIQFPDPSVTVEYDTDENQAEADRERIFADAAKQRYWIGAAHISFPGLGHVGERTERFMWIPGEYTTRMSVPAQ